jgi:ring-1,2-phenylacetyl-CoA epoxidase subunit PaaC
MPAASLPLDSILRLGDSCLVLGHRLSEWCGHAPELEEDIALANVALDLIGEAESWLALAASIEGRGRDADALAFHRDAPEWRSLALVEEPNDDFARTIVRQFLFDAWHGPVLDALSESRDERVAAIALRCRGEAAFHRRHSATWMRRLGDGTPESHQRMRAAVAALWPFTGALFAHDPLLGDAIDTIRMRWQCDITTLLRQATLDCPHFVSSHELPSRRHLAAMLQEMQSLARSDPTARW